MSDELRPCLCGQEQNERQMLVIEQCDSDGYFIKCDSCGACGPVGYPGENHAGADEEGKAKAIDMWNELWEGCERLRADLARKDAEIKTLEELLGAERELCCFYSNIAATLESAIKEAGFNIQGETAKVSEAQQQMRARLVIARAKLAAVRGKA